MIRRLAVGGVAIQCAALASCGEQDAALLTPLLGVSQHSLDADCERLGRDLVDHACLHAEAGPFDAVVAQRAEAGEGGGPAINTTHTFYTIDLPPSAAGRVQYRPIRGGEWAILTDRGTELSVLGTDGEPLISLLRDSTLDCEGLFEAHIFELEALAEYRIVFPVEEDERVSLVIEYLADFTPLMIRDRDEDGSGLATNDDDYRAAACSPPPGWVLFGSGTGHDDCDDEDPDVGPNAAEMCNGVDDDCNGLVDDLASGATCSTPAAGQRGTDDGDSEASERAGTEEYTAIRSGGSSGCSLQALPQGLPGRKQAALGSILLAGLAIVRRRRRLLRLRLAVVISSAIWISGCGEDRTTLSLLPLTPPEGQSPRQRELANQPANFERSRPMSGAAPEAGKATISGVRDGGAATPNASQLGGTIEMMDAGVTTSQGSQQDPTPSFSAEGCDSLAEGATCGDAAGHCIDGNCLLHYTEGHADLSVRLAFEGDSQKPTLHAFLRTSGLPAAQIGGNPAADGTLFELDKVAIVVTNKFFERPELDAFSPLCVATGESVSWLSQGNDSRNGQPFLGFEVAVDPAALVEGGVFLRLVGVNGPGDHSFWKDAFPPAFHFSSCDGLGTEDEVFLPIGHDHFNLGFSGDLGSYRLTYQLRALIKVDDGVAVPIETTFSVHFLTR